MTFFLLDPEVAWRAQLAYAASEADARTAFFALAMVGHAVAGGELLVAADSIALYLGGPSRAGQLLGHRLRHLNYAKDAILGRERRTP